MCLPAGYRPPDDLADAPLPDAVSPAWKAPTSGGSTGRPKLIVSGDPAELDAGAPPLRLMAPDGCLVMPGPLYHNGPVVWSCQALLAGNHVVVLPRFDAEATLAAIERYRADIVYVVPTMMKRIWRLPEDVAARLRPVVAARRVAPRRALPDVAQGGVDRLARARADLRAVRRHRGPGRDRHHRAPSGWSTAARSAGRSPASS